MKLHAYKMLVLQVFKCSKPFKAFLYRSQNWPKTHHSGKRSTVVRDVIPISGRRTANRVAARFIAPCTFYTETVIDWISRIICSTKNSALPAPSHGQYALSHSGDLLIYVYKCCQLFGDEPIYTDADTYQKRASCFHYFLYSFFNIFSIFFKRI